MIALYEAEHEHDLWRAHCYLGRVYRDLDDSRHAAEQFSRAIATHPTRSSWA
jgi:Tfp pilus assembly protein PilF